MFFPGGSSWEVPGPVWQGQSKALKGAASTHDLGAWPLEYPVPGHLQITSKLRVSGGWHKALCKPAKTKQAWSSVEMFHDVHMARFQVQHKSPCPSPSSCSGHSARWHLGSIEAWAREMIPKPRVTAISSTLAHGAWPTSPSD